MANKVELPVKLTDCPAEEAEGVKIYDRTSLDNQMAIFVVYDKMAWSVKTVKNNTPFTTSSVRLISGRCSPDYSYGITDPHIDVEQTGRAVLNIWNERVNLP